MRRFLLRFNAWLRRLACRLFGHTRRNASITSVGIVFCTRCLHIVEQRTVRERVTRGEIEARMRAYPPDGYSFVECNWKKRKAKFVAPSGVLSFVKF